MLEGIPQGIPQVDWLALRAPFTPEETEFRVQSAFDAGGKRKGVVVAYIDARAVMDRLDEIVGPASWSFDWTPLVMDAKEVRSAKGTLTICGVSKSDVGDAGPTEPTKACVSDALKRAAVHWGIGRYLYGVPVLFAELTTRGKQQDVLDDQALRQLRMQLRAHLRQEGQGEGAPTAQQERQQERQQVVKPAAPARPTPVAAPSVPAVAVPEDALQNADAETQQRIYDALRSKFTDRGSVERFITTSLSAAGYKERPLLNVSLLSSGEADLSRPEARALLTVLGLESLGAEDAQRRQEVGR